MLIEHCSAISVLTNADAGQFPKSPKPLHTATPFIYVQFSSLFALCFFYVLQIDMCIKYNFQYYQ